MLRPMTIPSCCHRRQSRHARTDTNNVLQVALPDITKFKPTKRAETTLEQREKKTAVGLTIGKGADEDKIPASLTGFESKLPPIVDREEERLAKSAAERFDEGPVVKGLKTATWFSICTLVLWEIYINSPLFHTPESPIM